MEGRAPIATWWLNDRGRVVADFFLRKGSKDDPNTLKIAPKASNDAAVKAIGGQLLDGSLLNLQMSLDYIPDRYWRAAVRSAYLSVFQVQRYEYVFSDGAAQVRSAVNGDSPVPARIVMEAFPEKEPPDEMLIMPHVFNDVGECFIVLLRLKSERTRYIVVFLPGKPGCDWKVFGELYPHAPQLRIETTPDAWTSKLFINLGFDPVSDTRFAKTLLGGSRPA